MTDAPSPDSRLKAARDGCTDWLARKPLSMRDELRELADLDAADAVDKDFYGDGGPVAALETRVAEVLGTESAVFFPSGVMAQQAALRIWCDRSGSRRVAMPDLSHLLVHEEDGPRVLHGFEVLHLTTGRRLPTAADVERLPGHVAAVLVELPLRDGGYLVPELAELDAISQACRDRSVALHLDGARLWEAAAALDVEPSRIAGLADTTYVSFYKGLGGLSGAAVGCAEDVAVELRLWRRRLGGTVYTTYPVALSALHGLDTMLPRMRELHCYARDLAVALGERGFRTVPEDVRSLAFRIGVEGTTADVRERAIASMERHHVQVPHWWDPSEVPGWSWIEVTVTPYMAQRPVAATADIFATLLP